ncbi:MAG: dicarboxylate/amino acid:cation symporter [Verrucomicrobia bacterium]|nr:dicarboxylate/amino acid:cation symporter [Verrucomicrobiota bacterium]
MKLHWKILISLILSFIIGLWSNLSVDQQSTTPAWFTGLKETCLFIGTLFLNGLKMVVIPLVVTSIICGVAKIGSEAGFGRLGLKTIGFYALTGFFAVCTGLLCVNLMNPGIVDDKVREKMLSSASDSQSAKIEGAIDHADKGLQGLVEIFHRMVPSNLFKAATEGQLLGLIFFGLLFGFFVSRLNPKARETQVAFWESLNAVILSITKLIISFAPIGVFGLVTPTLMQVGFETLGVMGKFAVTVLLGLAIHALVVLPLLLWVLGKINFKKHYQAMAPALLTAFSTASSSATLPLTMDCIRKRAGVSNKITSFTLPLGATINMDGTALFECVVVVFLAQLFGVEMGFVTQFTVVLMALLTSIGVAGIPSASLVAIIVILQAVGFPPESIAMGVGIVYVVDRILDMTRTAINVFGDSCAAVIIGKSEGESGYYESLASDK